MCSVVVVVGLDNCYEMASLKLSEDSSRRKLNGKFCKSDTTDLKRFLLSVYSELSFRCSCLPARGHYTIAQTQVMSNFLSTI